MLSGFLKCTITPNTTIKLQPNKHKRLGGSAQRKQK